MTLPDKHPTPTGLGIEYSSVFNDHSVVRAYPARPSYPPQLFAALARLLPGDRERRVLELGCGSGDLTVGLAPLVDSIDAVDPSAAMLAYAQRREPASTANVRWVLQTAESFEARGCYSMIVAAESLHWMDWAVVLKRAARILDRGAVFAIVVDRVFAELPWALPLRELIATYSMNRQFQAFDLVAELSQRALFRELGRCLFVRSFTQGVDDYVESFHSRNGFSRDRMDAARAAEFDAAVRKLVLAHAPNGMVSGEVSSTLVWGRPCA
jgi:SAM-dependent methyltransferase